MEITFHSNLDFWQYFVTKMNMGYIFNAKVTSRLQVLYAQQKSGVTCYGLGIFLCLFLHNVLKNSKYSKYIDMQLKNCVSLTK